MFSCPFCHLTAPDVDELQRHANSHFDDCEDDEQLARQIASSLPMQSNEVKSGMHFDDTNLGITGENIPSSIDDRPYRIDEEFACLITSQKRSSFYNVNGGLMSLMQKCLEQEPGDSTTYLSGYVDHYQSILSEDVGWGCGWRNIQMLASHLFSQRQDARDVLFGGSGFVPDIPSLQRWLELAWKRGFDTAGADHFNHTIYGSRKWIGTTECAALFRSFGIHARVVDFSPEELLALSLSVPDTKLGAKVTETNRKGKRQRLHVYGPMDKYMSCRDNKISQPGTTWNETSKESINLPGDSLGSANTENVETSSSRKVKSHQILMDWVWNYFSNESLAISGSRQVIVSNKTPLYFQHDGHSRTIVGIQVNIQRNGTQQYNLLILDPSQSTASLERSLKENVGWKKLIKRGVHTMKESQYQLCYIDPGIASGEEMEKLKTMDSILITL